MATEDQAGLQRNLLKPTKLSMCFSRSLCSDIYLSPVRLANLAMTIQPAALSLWERRSFRLEQKAKLRVSTEVDVLQGGLVSYPLDTFFEL